MLKVNLLPPYLNQQSKIRTAWILMAVLLAAELGALTFYQKGNIDTESQRLSDVQQKEAHVTRVQKMASDAKAERDKIQPIKNKTDFINQLLAFNKVRPDLYEHVASYVYQEVWISGMQAEENVLTMPASAKSISAVGRFLLFMQNNPDFTQVRISQVPGWPPGTSGVEAGPLTGGPGAGAAPGGSGGGPPGGAPGGSGGPMMGSSPGPPGGGPPGFGGGLPGFGGGAPGFGGPPGGSGGPGGGAPPIFGGGGEGGAPGLMNVPSPGQSGADALTGGGAPIPLASAVEQPKAPPVYFGFTVTGVLSKPITRPTFQYGSGPGGADTSGGYPMGSMGPYGSGAPGGPYGSGMPGGSGAPYSSGAPPGGLK